MTRALSWHKPEPECLCEYVDIGVGEQKAYEHPECPACVETHGPPLAKDVKKVLFGGDTHGDIVQVRYLVQAARKANADALFVLGDFGIWNHVDDGRFVSLVSELSLTHEIPVFFLPGNHENYDLLFQWEAELSRDADGFVVIAPGVGYSPRGHRWTWRGVRFMSLGGAYSIDKRYRVDQDLENLRKAELFDAMQLPLKPRQRNLLKTRQDTWWRQEEISQEELDFALRPGDVDILLTHDKPRASDPGWNRKDLEECWENQQAIQEVVDEKEPAILLHGHLHYAYGQLLVNKTRSTMVRGLDCDPDTSRDTGGSGVQIESFATLELLYGRAVQLLWADNDGVDSDTVLLEGASGTPAD